MKRWPLHRAYFWERAPFFRLLLPLLAGIVAYPLFALPLRVITISLAVLFISFLLALWRKQSVLSFIASQLCIVLIGWLLCYSNDIRKDKHWFGHKVNTADFFEARITETAAERENTCKLRVSTINTIEPGKISTAGGEAFVYVLKEDKLLNYKKGDTILLPNKWQAIHNAGNPFEFDYANYCARNNLYYQLLLPAKDIIPYARGNANDLSFTERCHDWCMQQLAHYIKNKQAMGLIQAMLIGDEVNLDSETRQAFADTGIVHIIAISGGNVAIFFIVIGWLLWWLRHKKYQWLKYLIALPLVWFYIMMAGSPPSAVRAAIMFSLLAVGTMFQKNNNSLNTLFATAFILLCAQPMWLYAIGFQLSFIAVLSLIIFYGPIYKLYGAGNKLTKILWQTMAASLAAEILVAPLVVYYFHLLPLLFIVANVAAYFFMGLVLILGIAVIVCSFIPMLAKLLGIACVWFVSVFDKIVPGLQACNPGTFYYLQIDNAELFLIYVIITGIAIALLNRQKNGFAISIFAACLLLSLLCIDNYTALHQRRLIVYNIGKGLHAELMEGKRYSVLATDTSIKPGKIIYATKPAHTGWHAWRQNELQDPPEILSIAGSTVLLYKDSVQRPNMNMKADYILLCQPAKIDAELLYNNFHPKCIVLPQLPEKQLEQWRMAAGKHSMPIHYLPEDGALILE